MLVKRSWGWWLTLINMERFKVKLLRFNPGKKLSVQKHNLRSELWCFLRGKGTFLLKDGWTTTRAGDYRLVPFKTAHCYQALSKTLVLEIQFGERCIEDDIERLS